MFRFFHRYGFGIQSPWAYSLVRDVFYEPLGYYAYDTLRKKYPQQTKHQRRQNEQLFRIFNHFKPETVMTLGTISTISTQYIKAAYKPIRFISEAETNLPFRMLLVGKEADPSMTMKFINANESTDNDSMIIIEGINKENKTLWQQILASETISVSFDMKPRGMAFTDRKRVKQDYKL